MRARGRFHGRNSLAAWVTLLLLLGHTPATAQSSPPVRFVIDRDASLAWYQANPHTNMLWATSCPGDPFWRPGESRNAGWDTHGLPAPTTGAANVLDTVIPLYRRARARPLCPRAVRGEIFAEDTITWRGVHGQVTVFPDSMVSGLPLRDQMARRVVFASGIYPEIRFIIDSLIDVQPGDTLRANAVGTFALRNVTRPMAAKVRAWREPIGLRVIARLDMLPHDLVEVYEVSSRQVMLGVGSGVWRMLHFGVDAVLKPAP